MENVKAGENENEGKIEVVVFAPLPRNTWYKIGGKYLGTPEGLMLPLNAEGKHGVSDLKVERISNAKDGEVAFSGIVKSYQWVDPATVPTLSHYEENYKNN